MSTVGKVLKYQVRDVARSRWLIGYTLLLFALTEGLYRLGGGGERLALSLINVVLILVPLVSLMFGTPYLYNAREFIEMLLAQPMSRGTLFGGLYWGLSLPLILGLLAGLGLPLALHGGAGAGTLLAVGIALTLVFTALAFLVAVRWEDRAKGLGVALLVWLLCSVLYDGLVLLALVAFEHYPMERPALVLTLLNPIDLARVLLLLRFDIAVLMGYTGAVFERFFGTGWGMLTAALALVAWTAVPLALGLRRFRTRDF